MTTRTYDKKNYIFLYRGLLIVRDALLQFIVTNLKDFYGGNWWESSVEPAFRADDIEKLKLQFQKRFSSSDGPARPGTELYEILDLNYFGNVIEYNWKKVFAQTLNNDRTLLIYIKEVVAYRNPVAHTETGDLHDDDTFRGLDTGDRLLRLIDKNAADEIGKIKNEMRNAWIYEEIGLGASTPEKVGVSIEKGFERLEEEIKKKNPETTDVTLLSNLKETVFSGINALREQGNLPEVVAINKLAFESLEKLSQKYLSTSFSTACLLFAPLPKFTAKEVSQQTLNIKQEIDALQGEINRLELDIQLQENIGLDRVQFSLSRVEFKKQLLHAKKNDFEKIRNESSAPVFFSVSRNLEKTVQEETNFIVSVEVKNLGKKKTMVSYQEGFSPDLILIDGQFGFDAEIEPDSSYIFSYTCLCNISGSHTLFTNQLDYAEKLSGWDSIEDTTILALPGKGPRLVGKRYYQFARNSIDIIVQLENLGDKIAHALNLHDTITIKTKKTCELIFQGELKPKQKTSISSTINVSNISEIVLPEKTRIDFQDNTGKEFSVFLEESYSLLEYSFPSDTEIIGRQAELQQAEKVFKIITGLSTEGELFSEKHIILLEGVAGIGKSRFLQRIGKLATDQYDFHFYVEDVSNRSPVKRILRRILDLDVNFTTQEAVWNKLNKLIPNASNTLNQLGVLVRFLTSDYEKFGELEIQGLITNVLLIIRQACQKSRYFLVFENAHEFSAGVEFDLFQKIIKYAAESKDIILSVGVAYRPIDQFPGFLLGDDVRESRCEKIVLETLNRDETTSLIETLIPFPSLCEEFQDFVFEWSNGNPFYIKELLRHLVSSEKGYIQRIGDSWYPSSNFRKETFTNGISSLVLQRAKEDAGDGFLVLQVLSVVGLELPYRLLAPLFKSSTVIPLDERRLLDVLEKLERLGFVQKSQIASSAKLEYKFEHQLIRDAIYEDVFRTVDHTFIREQLVNVLIANKYKDIEIFSDGEEYYRQVARHLLHASSENQFENKDYLLRAARIEEIRRNFVRAVEYYDCFIACSNKQDNHLEQVDALISCAIISKSQGEWVKAKRQLELALNILPPTKEKTERKQIAKLHSKILVEQGFLFIKTREYEKADACLSNVRLNYEGLLHYRRLFPPHEKYFFEDLVEIYLSLAEIWYIKLDAMPPSFIWNRNTPFFSLDDNVSSAYFKRAEMLANDYRKISSDNMLAINVWIREAEIFSTGEERKIVLKKLQGAIETMQKQSNLSDSDIYVMERAFSHLAEIYRDQNEREKARQYYDEARKIQEKLQDIYGLAISNAGIGDLYIEQEQYTKAEYYLLEAFKYQQLVGDTDRFWKTCFSLTKVNLEVKNLEKAKFHWSYARPFILERIHDIKPQIQDDIFHRIYAFAKIYFDGKTWEEALPLCLDLQVITHDANKLIKINEMLGKVYYEMKDPEHAIKVLYEGLDLTTEPLRRADIYSMLGDILSTTKNQNYREQTEENYEECVKIFMENKLSSEALSVYDKLLRYMSTEKDSQRLSPLLHNLIELMFRKQRKIDIRFVEKAEKLFNRYELFKDAGDAFVHMAYKMAQLDAPEIVREYDNQDQKIYQRELLLLKKAQEYYSKCESIDDKVGGYYKLTSVYFRMNFWDEIAGCYKLILIACMTSNEPQVFIDALREVGMMHDKFSFSDLEEVIVSIKNVQSVFESADVNKFTDEQKYTLMLRIAKIFISIADKTQEKDVKSNYTELSLAKYNELIDESNISAIKGVCYNDSALLLQGMGRLDEAQERLMKAIDLAKANQNQFSEACSRANLGRFFMETHKTAKAQVELEYSVKILARKNNYWDERKRNQDTSPLTGLEIPQLRFEKSWLASVASDYGQILYRTNQTEALAWLHLAQNVFAEIKDEAQAQSITKLIEMLEKLQPHQIDSSFERFQARSLETINTTKYIQCGSCRYSYTAEKRRCPRCNAKTCPNCGQITSVSIETCQHCDHWVGL